MEGVTDNIYRQTIEELYPEWDLLVTDFLRVPAAGKYPKKHLIKHIGKEHLDSKNINKTIYQILTSSKAYTKELVKDLEEINIPWIDINLGCPSKTVVKNKGGSYLLSSPKELEKIIIDIRENFKKTFTAKIRIGFKDDKLFIDNLKMLEARGVEAITIHGRTREQLYKGKANWNYIKEAVKAVNIPIIANGDIWNETDIDDCFHETGCHSVMIARGAMRTPWLASNYRNNTKLNPSEEIIKYFKNLQNKLIDSGLDEVRILKRFKGLSRYIFEHFKDAQSLKSQALRSQFLCDFNKILIEISSTAS